MKNERLKSIKKILIWMAVLFVLLFIFRLAYGYTLKDNVGEQYETLSANYNNSSNERFKNYASANYEVKSQKGQSQQAIKVDQKYEKIASIQTKTSSYASDEGMARKSIEAQKALIQQESKQGNAGDRSLSLFIGVPPDNFDALYESLTKVGRVSTRTITKTDKTNEFKELNAKRMSLEKIRISLVELKTKGGRIDEYMQLENKIFEIDEQLQNLGVSLGEFDAENEFCTIDFSLNEEKEHIIGLLHRTKVALKWATGMYIKFLTMAVFALGAAYLLLLVADKTNLIRQIIQRKE